MPRRKQNFNLLGRKSALQQIGEAHFSERYPQREARTPARPKRSKRTGAAARESGGWGKEESEKALKRWRRMGFNPDYKAHSTAVLRQMLEAPAQQVSAEQKRAIERVLAKRAKSNFGYTDAGAGRNDDSKKIRQLASRLGVSFGHAAALYEANGGDPRKAAAMHKGMAKSKKNPEAAAAELSEAWHGKPASTATDYRDKIRYHAVLTDLGRLFEVKVYVDDSHAKAVKFNEATRLASNEEGEQLYIQGGDQRIDLDAFGITGHAAKKDLLPIGTVYSVTYMTAKHHLGKEDKQYGPYEHVFREHDQEEPELVYDTMNDLAGFSGGEYHIDRDMAGGYSAGIRD